jgi:hypothetical protein
MLHNPRQQQIPNHHRSNRRYENFSFEVLSSTRGNVKSCRNLGLAEGLPTPYHTSHQLTSFLTAIASTNILDSMETRIKMKSQGSQKTSNFLDAPFDLRHPRRKQRSAGHRGRNEDCEVRTEELLRNNEPTITIAARTTKKDRPRSRQATSL